ncbi:g2225 [Coccomyxa viridis]|uniref:G2225 protein n=1 Tax=Coccomyxa viridis TaxID=1274662 RepID=A0ABP1FNR8_9CHLO
MVRRDAAFFVNGRNQKLRTVEYLPDQETRPKAIVFFHHGYGEHISRYEKVHTRLAEAGIAVYGYDHHGHGESDPKAAGERALVHDFNHLVDDSVAFAWDRRRRHPPNIPCISAGQSMGGLIATHLVLRDQDGWAGLILCSAAIDVEWTFVLRLQAPIGGLLANLLPRAQIVPAVPLEYISNDPEVVQHFAQDPLNFVGDLRARTANEILKGFRDIQKKEKLLRLPILAIHGTADKITSYTAVKRLLANAASTDTALKEFPGGYHELLQGPEKEEAFVTLRDWILRHSREPDAKL